MFKLQQKALVWWPVTIKVPVDGGTVSEHEVKAQFELINQDEYDDLAQLGDEHIVKRVVKDWQDINDENGKALAFTPENLTLVVKIPYARMAFLLAYMSAVSGAPAKN